MEGEDYDACLFQVNRTHLDMSHYIIHNIHGLEFTSDESKDYSPE
jgi:hypothetical protein